VADDERLVPAWQLWKNPIFRRYARSRLRPKTLVPWMLVVGLFTGFIFLLLWVGGTRASGFDVQAVARVILVVMVPIQAVLLLLMGTGSIASGVMQESGEGGIDYQRLTPLSPLTKIVGYLFGLPVREYVLFFVTVPFTLISIVAGRVPLDLVAALYMAFFSAALLYHLSGCVTGMVVNRRFAARTSQFVVVVLYLLLPQIAKLGFEFFSYLTILPVLSELIAGMSMPQARAAFDTFFGTGTRSVSLFGMEVEALPFTLLIQGTLIGTFVVILYRKWRQPTHHMLGKNFATGLCIWIHLLLLGSTIPLIESGEIFPSEPQVVRDQKEEVRTRMENERAARIKGGIEEAELADTYPGLFQKEDGKKDPMHAFFLSSSYGLGALLMSCGLILIITPSRDEFTKGLRRARKLGRKRVPWNADGASALPHTLIIGGTGVIAWAIFAHQMFGATWFEDVKVAGEIVTHSPLMLKLVPFTQLLVLLCFWAVLEWGGRGTLLMYGLFGWVVPMMAAMILLFADDGLHSLAIHVGGLSGVPSPFYAMSVPFDHPSWVFGSMAQMFVISTVLYMVMATILFRRVKRRHREIIASVESVPSK